MAPRRGFTHSYLQLIFDAQDRLSKEIPELEMAVTEGIIRFASNMLEYGGERLPSALVVHAAVVVPHAVDRLVHKIRFDEQLYQMLRVGKCIFQGRCFYFGLPICRWCEQAAPWYPPGYYVSYEVIVDDPPNWGIDDDEV